MADKKYVEILSDQNFEKCLLKFNRSIKSFEEDIDTILLWIQQQPHLPKEPLERNIIACTLFECKCSVEKAKSKIDWLFTVHSILPEFFKNALPRSERVLKAQKYLSAVVIPKLTEKNERIHIFKYGKIEDDGGFCAPDVAANMFNALTLLLLEDRMEGRIFILDAAELKFSYIKQIGPPFMKKCLNAIEKGFSLKFNAAHLINLPPYFSPILTVIKQFLKPKLRERIFIHENIESFKKSVSKQCLPSDYDGDFPSIIELQKMQNEALDKYTEFFEKREKWTVDEKQRPQKLDTDDIFGIQGNFKKLDVD